MRVVILHESPGADHLARDFAGAADSFNRGLDFRLRFLDVGFEYRLVPVPAEGEVPSVLLEGTLARFEPAAVLVLGGGLPLLECAALAARRRAPLAYFADGRDDRTARAIARLSRILLAAHDAPAMAPDPAGVREDLSPSAAPGPTLVRLLVRSVREKRAP